MSTLEQQRARERSPGTESFYSAREEDTASLASFYMDAYDDLTADEFQSAEESERETTPLGRDSSAESTPRQTPLREARRDELPKQFEKRHSHDYGSVFHREVGKPLILQRSSSYMRDGPFDEQSQMQKVRSYSSVDYLNDSYDRALPGRRAPPDRKRQRQISLERMAKKERGKSAEPELGSEIRLAFESPFDVPLPRGDELEKLKKRLSSLKSTEDEIQAVAYISSSRVTTAPVDGSEAPLTPLSPFDVPLSRKNKLNTLKNGSSSPKANEDGIETATCVELFPSIQRDQASQPHAPSVPPRTRMRESATSTYYEATKPMGELGPSPTVFGGTSKSSELVSGSTNQTAEAPDLSTSISVARVLTENWGIGSSKTGSLTVSREFGSEHGRTSETACEGKPESEHAAAGNISTDEKATKLLSKNLCQPGANGGIMMNSFSTPRGAVEESTRAVRSTSSPSESNPAWEGHELLNEDSLEIIPPASTLGVNKLTPQARADRFAKHDTNAHPDANHTSNRFSEYKTVFKETSLLLRDYAPKFSRTASFESTPVFVHKPMGSFDLQFDLDRSPSREPSPPARAPPRPTMSSSAVDDGISSRDPFPDLSLSSWNAPTTRKERAESPTNGRPPPGRKTLQALVAPLDIPKRPARTKRGARSAGTSRQHSMTRDETRDSTRDLHEQIQNLLSSLQKKLNKSSSLGRSPNLTDEAPKYESDGRNSTSASNSSLSWKPTRYSSIRREATMEKLENILSTSSETKKNVPAVFDAESIEELTTYGHIGNYEAADKKDSKIFEEFDKHFDLMLEADSGEEDDFVKIVDESHAAQSFRMSVLNGNQTKISRDSQDLNNISFDSARTISSSNAGKLWESYGPPPVPAKRRSSRISAQSLPQQQIIQMQNEQLKELQRHQEELERKMKLLQEQIELRKAHDEERAPSIPVKCKFSRLTGCAESFYSALSPANPVNYRERVILPSDEDFFNLQTNIIDRETIAFDLNGLLLNPRVFNDQSATQMQTNYVQTGDHRSPAERADTSGNLQIPYDDFVFEVGSPVGVMLPPDLRLGNNAGGGMAYGVVRWAGYINDEPMLGLEMDEDAFNGGYLNDVFYFECEPGKGFFARPEQCVPDERIQQMTLMDESPHDDHALTVAYDSLPGDFPPLFNAANSKDLSLLVGRCKGIQGHHNSCYLDATLFAMFTTTSVFDFILDRPREEGDIPEYEEVTRVLKEDIVNSIRVHRFVGAAQVMKLRELLDKLGSVSGLTCEEKDPEEFLNCLTQMLQVEPFLHLSSGQSAHLYQMFVEKDEDLGLPWFQQILEQSFFQQELKLQQMPSVFIVQMPRFGRQFKVYPRVLPSFQLDMTDLLMNSPRPCHICASLAHLECIDCYQQTKSIEKSTFCDACYNRKHLRLSSHQASSKRLTVSAGFQDFSLTKHLPRQTMELFALLCIETSHYVAFVKCGQQSNSPWVFFDSMADRQGQNNIPEVVNFDDIYEWLAPDKLAAHPDDRSLPPLVKKIVSDAYMCFYRSNTVAMYN